MSAVYRISERKCATCRWWNGERGLEFRGNQPYYVKVGGAGAPCMAWNSQQKSPATNCSRWEKWEKI